MKKILGILIVIAIIAAIFILRARKAETPEEETPEGTISEEATPENTTGGAIGQDLEGIDTGDLEEELKGIDADLKELQ